MPCVNLLMAADAGLLNMGQEIIAIADTPIVCQPTCWPAFPSCKFARCLPKLVSHDQVAVL
jgi:hypothetical protein